MERHMIFAILFLSTAPLLIQTQLIINNQHQFTNSLAHHPPHSTPLSPLRNVVVHHLKWITNQTQFPLEISIPLDSSAATKPAAASQYWDWLRLNDNKYVSKMTDLLKNYLVTETSDKVSLTLLNYNNLTHEQLGSYEPRLTQTVVAEDGEKIVELKPSNSNKRDIFTTAYLKAHYIKTEKFPERIKVTCVADFLIANTTMTDTIMSMMERYASFKMAIKSVQARWGGPAPGPRIESHNRNHLNKPNEPRRPLIQLTELIEKMMNYQPPPPQLLQRQQQQQQQPILYQHQYPTLQIQQHVIQPQFQPVFQQQQPLVQPQLQPQPQQPQQQQQQPQPQTQAQPQQQTQQQPQQQQPQISSEPKVISAEPQLVAVQQQALPLEPQQTLVLPEQKVTQYQQQYQPVHHQLPVAQVSHLQPALYRSDLMNFYNNLFYPTPVSSAPYQSASNSRFATSRNFYSPVAVPLAQSNHAATSYYPSYYGQSSPYDYYFTPRLGKRNAIKREVKSIMVEAKQEKNSGKFEYDLDYDESKFLKIRLSLGPVSLYRPFDREEVVSCDLNLINIDKLVSDFQNKIYEIIKTDEYFEKQQEAELQLEESMSDRPQSLSSNVEKGGDMMFLIDNPKKDPAIEVNKLHLQKIANRPKDMSISEIVAMDRQLAKLSSSAVSSNISKSSYFAFSILTTILSIFIGFFSLF